MHVGPGFAFRRNAIERTDCVSVHQDDALVALAHLRNVALHDDRLAIELREHLQQRVEILVVAFQPEHARTAIPVERLDDDVAMRRSERADFLPVRCNARGRHDALEQRHEQLLRRVAHVERIVDHKRLGMNPLEQMSGRNVGHVERRVLPHEHHVRLR
jgi:hypothetical protein